MQLPQHIPNGPRVQRGERANRAWVRADAALSGTGVLEFGRPPVRSLYIHTPFCVHKCHYCDFYSFVDTRDQQAAFVERLVAELTVLAPAAGGQPLKTLFVGGGTPSLLRPDLWKHLLNVLNDLFDLSYIRADGRADELGLAEFTVECNPESATPELMGVLRSGGVNRVSVGAQSFVPRHLKTLERWHDPDNVTRAISAARAAGVPRQSLDLIFAIPGQTLEEWEADLDRALSLGTTHVSCYNLTYEPNTAMSKRLAMGEFKPVEDGLEAEMFELTVARLRAAGHERYEVSNFAHPGHESRHNIAYWVQDQWLAAGPSASGHVLAGASFRSGSHRWKNLPRLGDYLESESGFAPIVDHESPEPLRLIRERLMMGLRLAIGLDAAELLSDLQALAPGAVPLIESEVRRQQDRGLVKVSDAGTQWSLTDAGFMMADAVAADLMACVE